MSSLPTVFVGIDYHSEVSQVCVLSSTGACLGNQPCQSDAGYLEKYVSNVGEKSARIVAVIEACCGAAQIADSLRSRGWKVELAHPGYANRLKQSPDKTDKQDAALLADLGRVGYVPRVWLPPEHLRQLRSLFRYRQQFADRRRHTKQRIRGLMRESGLRIAGRGWTKVWLGELRARLDELGEHRRWIVEQELESLKEIDAKLQTIEGRLAATTRKDPITQRLLAEKGVGRITAVAMRAEIGDFSRFQKGKQLSRFCGLSPCNRSSGQRQVEAGLVRAGNRRLRSILVEAAHRLVRTDPRWKALSDRLVEKGRSKSEAVVAVANRWVRWLHHRIVDLEKEIATTV